jgi:transposase
MTARKTYSDEFKQDAIHLLETSGKKLSEIEEELGLPHGLIRKWQQRFQINSVDNSLELNEVEQLKAELRILKRENEILRQERDILKKTVGIFSQSERR